MYIVKIVQLVGKFKNKLPWQESCVSQLIIVHVAYSGYEALSFAFHDTQHARRCFDDYLKIFLSYLNCCCH
jgi:hypothetical protein